MTAPVIVASLRRFVVRPSRPVVPPALLWLATAGVLSTAFYLGLRSCSFDFGAVASYVGYLALFVALPGTVVLLAVSNRGPLSWTKVIALGLPTGFAVEIFTYLGLASVGAKNGYVLVPLMWIVVGTLLCAWRKTWPVRWRFSGAHAGLALGMSVVFLGTVTVAAGQMFAEAPLAAGMPARAIFHDWVYLLSRASNIKHQWPLDDPSLAGRPMQYHYFMMVHAAAASWTTQVELTLVFLRLMVVPLGGVMAVQAFALGRRVSRSPWGGLLAAVLVVMAGEASFAPSYGHTMFLGLFTRWLFVSPTFYFGMIFCGALLLAVGWCGRLARCGVRHYVWLFMLAAAGTGAKGTLLPVLITALGLWTVWRWLIERRLPVRQVLFGLCLGGAFAVVYFNTMSEWRTGDAAFRPFHVFKLTSFWQEYLPAFQAWFGLRLPAMLATPLATGLCAAVVFAGTCGVRVLAIPYLLSGATRQQPMTAWLGAFFVASCGMGLLMELNSYGELYLILMIQLPMAALSAAFVVDAFRSLAKWRATVPWLWPAKSASALAAADLPLWARGTLKRWGVLALGTAVVVSAFGVQTTMWWSRNRTGFSEWLATPTKLHAGEHLQRLEEALLWVRKNTEPDAVLVANAFTPENIRHDHWGALDGTLIGVYYYYSALSERRLWVEGPSYLVQSTSARMRMSLAAAYFYRGRAPDPTIINASPSYLLVDRSLPDAPDITLPRRNRVFANARIEIYRIPRPLAPIVGVTSAK